MRLPSNTVTAGKDIRDAAMRRTEAYFLFLYPLEIVQEAA